MATSIASRRQGIMTGKGGSSELLQAGVTQRALAAVAAQYPDDAWAGEARAYVRASVESVVPFTLNATHNALSYPMDRLSTGNAMLALYAPGDAATEPFRAAAAALRRSIDLNRRNPEGGLWYFVYPQWSYLDGMYSLAPFYTLYATAAPSANSSDACAADAALDDMYYQIDLLWNRTRDAASGLLVHGYDASGTAVWARAGTGASPHVWGRSLGWYAMALVDTLEVLPPAGAAHGGGAAARHRGPLLAKFQALAAAVAAAADPRTGAWWQVLDAPGRAGNYIESSASAMFAYALLKGARLGYLDVPPPPPPPAYGDSGRPPLARAAATALALRAYRYINQAFLVREPNGTLSYDRTVAVCSLNSTASYEYYVNQPINYNSVLGSAPYVLASLEVERLLGAS
ncbi:Six-hairpin glycosidase-like protein [Durotheca rogersii]|uniref:Six-hairpin glycosidase-like protein n=1 Tax=Durotheca rogersii TaxID=419775 RepID=UPI00221E963B|nr:Six-hairpin glycosidase-like protein [Durotheca rogersii]KAI5867668.1 Six-hairpin glycosidase-like protein [Durotheca rogersii]